MTHWPLVLSGDCPTGLAVVAGLQRRHRDIAVGWLDAHGDFNTPAIRFSCYLGGMPVAMLTGRAPELFADPLGLRPRFRSIDIAAGRRTREDLDPAERDALAASQVRRIPATAGAFRAALSGLGGLPVYLHVDVDIMDSAEVPGLRFPSGPGPTLADIGNCLTSITASVDVVAAGLRLRLAPWARRQAVRAGRDRPAGRPRSAPSSSGHRWHRGCEYDQPGTGVQRNMGQEC